MDERSHTGETYEPVEHRPPNLAESVGSIFAIAFVIMYPLAIFTLVLLPALFLIIPIVYIFWLVFGP